MHWAAHFGHVAIAMILVKNELHVYDTDRFGNTPVHQAVKAKRLDIIKFFMAIGIETSMVNNEGQKPIDLVEGDHEIKELLMDHDSARKCFDCKKRFEKGKPRYYCEDAGEYFGHGCCVR